MSFARRRTAAFTAATLAALALAACSGGESEEPAYEEGNIETIVESANTDEPMTIDDDMSFDEEAAPGAMTNTDAEMAPPALNASSSLEADEMTLDHAAATGMTSRVDRSAERSVPQNGAPTPVPAQ